MKTYRRQHYVPQFYLSGFTIDNTDQLFVLNKENKKVFIKNIDEVCEQSYYYSYKDDEQKHNIYNSIVEEELAKKDDKFSLVLNKIIKNIEGYYYYSKDIDKFVRKDRLIFLEFLYYQILRVPKYIDRLFYKGMIFLENLNKKYNYTRNKKEMINDIKKIMFPILFDNKYEFISILDKRKWAFFIINKNLNEYFISSDNPVIISNSEINVSSVGIIDPMTEISIPISKNIILSIRETYIKHKLEYHLINSLETIKNLNTLIKNNSMKFTYSGIERLIK
jgi:hypothetical protein